MDEVVRSTVEETLNGRRGRSSTQALWGTRVGASTVSDLNQKINGTLDEWRERTLVGEFPYVFLDGLWLKRSWGGEVKNVSVLVAIGVAQSGYREILAMKPALRTIEPEHSRTSRREKIGKSTSAAM